MSDPAIKEAVLAALKERGPVSATSYRGLRDQLGLQCTLTQFSKAVRSLHYKPGARRLQLSSWRGVEGETRFWRVSPL